MNRNHYCKRTVVAAAIALALGSSATLAQQSGADERTEEIQQAEDRLDRAEDGLQRAEERVDQRQEDLEQARDSAESDFDLPVSADRDDGVDSRSVDSRGDPSELDGIVEEHDDLSSFMEALQVTGLGDSLTGDTAYTVFAPTNEAFDEKWNDLQGAENREELIEVLRAHIVADDVDAERARTLDQALTVDGGVVSISEEDGELMVGDAKVVDWDIAAGNLRIHTIDGVLEANPAEATAAVRDSDADRDGELDFDPDFDDEDADRESTRDN